MKRSTKLNMAIAIGLHWNERFYRIMIKMKQFPLHEKREININRSACTCCLSASSKTASVPRNQQGQRRAKTLLQLTLTFPEVHVSKQSLADQPDITAQLCLPQAPVMLPQFSAHWREKHGSKNLLHELIWISGALFLKTYW